MLALLSASTWLDKVVFIDPVIDLDHLHDGMMDSLIVVDAVAYLHAHKVIHNDIKGDNIVMQDAAALTPTPILLDFELSKVAGADLVALYYGDSGMTSFAAPELISGMQGRPTAKTDVYSLGRVLYDLFYPGRLSATARVGHVAELEFPDGNKRLEKLICAMMAGDPADRPHASDVLHDAFFTS